MRSRFSSSLLVLSLLVFSPALGKTADSNPATLAASAISADKAESARAIAELRSMGPPGLKELRQVYAKQIQRHIDFPLEAETPEWIRLQVALDAVSQQKDSYLGGLYWYTDFEKAKTFARISGKPILSLRLLGKLSEEFSCANSRFFRTVLYSNAAVSQRLRENFILHWQSVRAAPRVTIDFGDGRKLERTLTGNSIHYILDSEGRAIDALPGLYGPQAFLRLLEENQDLLTQMSKEGKQQAEARLREYHRNRVNAINLAWLADANKIGKEIPKDLVVIRNQDGTPQALAVASLAITKAYTERTVLRSMTAGSEALGAITDEADWRKIAELHMEDARLDDQSIGLIKRQTYKIIEAARSKRGTDLEFWTLLQKLHNNIALDTVRNEYSLHTKLHGWLVTDVRKTDLEAFNNKVYAELFLTPATDPWLGLFSTDTYVALDGGGIR
ncbi:MAG TPA: hypothetical protein VJU86_17380 [Pyrinomonadaceae bacterium]|nr:hypothetical protein [Pyrinomonadaceae bacterium]